MGSTIVTGEADLVAARLTHKIGSTGKIKKGRSAPMKFKAGDLVFTLPWVGYHKISFNVLVRRVLQVTGTTYTYIYECRPNTFYNAPANVFERVATLLTLSNITAARLTNKLSDQVFQELLCLCE